jgi:glycosyltransferase involved in cell wall biosynthesis
MHLAFDAKRAFNNGAGLGNYSRNLLLALAQYYPENQYRLYTPSKGKHFEAGKGAPFEIELPMGLIVKAPSLWRTFSMVKPLKVQKPDLYHGLSHELPVGIGNSGIASVVTMHDLIFERFPQWYQPVDRLFYRLKYRFSCRAANRIIAIGQQTANDLTEFWNVEPEKIDIVRQSCHSAYWLPADVLTRNKIREQYRLPAEFLLQVGTIEPRKNQLNTLKALVTDHSGLPLVILGKQTAYMKQLVRFIVRHSLQSRVIFLHNVPFEHLPALYQMASVTLYPSIFEGFGIPVLESIVSGTPVITTNELCFTDAGGNAALYVSPFSPDELAHSLDRLLTDQNLYQQLLQKGQEHSKAFTPENFARNTIGVYQKTLENRFE